MLRILAFSLTLSVLSGALVGCRPAAPPSFSPGPDVDKLTEGVDDQEDLQLYRGLQTQIARILAEKTGTPEKPIMLGETESTSQLQLGYRIYSDYCTQCHGVNGDGNGPVAEYMHPRPRNYTKGIFKFTSTPYGSKPRKADLKRTLQQGVVGTSMPAFDRFTTEQIDAVVEYVLALTHRGELERELAAIAYDEEELPEEQEEVDELVADLTSEILEPWHRAADQIVMPVTSMPPMSDETVRIGHKIFLEQACNKCHGKYGRGGSMEKVEVGVDAWGNQAAAADLSSGMFHGGGRPIDIYRRIYSGINGTPMPAFEKTFQENPDSIWYLVQFIKATGNRRREGLPPLSEQDLPVEEPATTQSPAAADSPGEAAPAEESPGEEKPAEESAQLDQQAA